MCCGMRGKSSASASTHCTPPCSSSILPVLRGLLIPPCPALLPPAASRPAPLRRLGGPLVAPLWQTALLGRLTFSPTLALQSTDLHLCGGQAVRRLRAALCERQLRGALPARLAGGGGRAACEPTGHGRAGRRCDGQNVAVGSRERLGGGGGRQMREVCPARLAGGRASAAGEPLGRPGERAGPLLALAHRASHRSTAPIASTLIKSGTARSDRTMRPATCFSHCFHCPLCCRNRFAPCRCRAAWCGWTTCCACPPSCWKRGFIAL